MKKIKFALLLGDKPCRSLEDIRENFNTYDIIKNFDTGVLLNWLKTYNLDELYDKAILIDKNSSNRLDDLLNIFIEDENKHKEIKNKYEYIVSSIILNKKDYDFVKSTISSNYKILMESYSDFFERLKSSKCIFGILSVLSNEDTRDYFLNDKNIMDSIKNDVIRLPGSKYGGLFSIAAEAVAHIIMGYLCIFGEWYGGISKETTEYDYVFNKIKIFEYKKNKAGSSKIVKNKKCLIIYLSSLSCSITSSKDESKSYTSKDINNKFLILDGINLINHDEFGYLVYMEI